MNLILHITQRERWDADRNAGEYRSDSLDTEGFIHCSTFAQVVGSANRFFHGQTDLVILVIASDRVAPEIRYEGVDPTNLFPHIYGSLNIDAVDRVIPFSSQSDGSFVMPPQLL
jgi:uncharacterized protein (DUF952 family)